MPAHNAERLIGEAIRGILSQGLPDFELIVVDEGSTERTLEVVREFDDPRIRLLVNERNRGSVSAANRAIAEARGSYIARIDPDDLSGTFRLEREVDFLEKNPDLPEKTKRRFPPPDAEKPAP